MVQKQCVDPPFMHVGAVTTEGGDADDADAESAPKPTSRGRRKKTTTASKAERKIKLF